MSSQTGAADNATTELTAAFARRRSDSITRHGRLSMTALYVEAVTAQMAWPSSIAEAGLEARRLKALRHEADERAVAPEEQRAPDTEEQVHPASPQGRPARAIRLRYPGRCSSCGTRLATGDRAEWQGSTRQLTCLSCAGKPQPETASPGAIQVDVDNARPERASEVVSDAGGSARREFERRHAKRQRQIAARWGRLAPVVNFFADDPQSTKAWARGSDGERRLAAHLERMLGDAVVLLHDRRVPSTRSNIDHLAIASSGVWVIDAKNYQGRVERRDVGGWFKVDYRLYVGGRNRTRLLEGIGWQMEAVRDALGGIDVPVHGALCFTDATWRLFAKPFRIGGAWVTWADALAGLIGRPGVLGPDDVAAAADQLARVLRPAAPAKEV